MIRILSLSLAFALATRVLGWPAVAAVAFAWGAMASRERTPIDAVVCALVAWSALLLLAALDGPVAEVARVLGGIIGVPGWAMLLVTLAFGAGLAWSAGIIGRELARVLRFIMTRRARPASGPATIVVPTPASPASDGVAASTRSLNRD